jgi:hypothetical protein
MCAPCKVVINSRYRQSAELADLTRDQIEENAFEEATQADPESPSYSGDGTGADEGLYALALAEVEAIERVNACAKSALLGHLSLSTKRKKDPRSKESAAKWAALVERLFR